MSKFFQVLERAQQEPEATSRLNGTLSDGQPEFQPPPPPLPTPPNGTGRPHRVEKIAETSDDTDAKLDTKQPQPEQVTPQPIRGPSHAQPVEPVRPLAPIEPVEPIASAESVESAQQISFWPDPAADSGEDAPHPNIDAHLVSLLDPTTFEAEQYRALAHALERAREDTGCVVIAVSSPAVGDGKTTTTINLAGALAQTYERILLVDADLRRPTVSRLLGLSRSGKRGLADVVQETSLGLHEVIHPFPPYPLHVMPAGRATALPDNMLNSARIETLFEELRHHYDYIIVDTPPLIPFPDCRLIEQWVDGFLVVVTAHKTPRKLVEEAIATIDEAKLVGLIFNGDDRSVFGYYSYYSHAYGPHRKKNWHQRLVRRATQWGGTLLRRHPAR